MPRINISQELLDQIRPSQGRRQTIGEVIAELLAQRASYEKAIDEIACGIPQSSACIAFEHTAIPDFPAEDQILYVKERLPHLRLPMQTVPDPATAYDDVTAAGSVVGPSVWEWLRNPAV